MLDPGVRRGDGCLLIQLGDIAGILRGGGDDVVAVKAVGGVGAAGEIFHRRRPFAGFRSRAAVAEFNGGRQEGVADVPRVGGF